MGEKATTKWAQFVCFKPKIAISKELFQETWIPLAKAFRARGIALIILSEKANVQNDLCDYHFISKNLWDSKDALLAAFPNGLELAAPSIRAPVAAAQIGCFHVVSVKLADCDMKGTRHEELVQDEIKVFVMFTEPLSREEVITKGETLCLVKGFQSYCIYELDKDVSENPSKYYSWIIEAFFQSFFKDSLLKEILDTGQFKDCELAIHQDAVQFTM